MFMFVHAQNSERFVETQFKHKVFLTVSQKVNNFTCCSTEPKGKQKESYFSSLRANVSLPSARGETWPRTRCFSWVRRSPCSFLTSGAYALVEPLPVAPAPRDSHSPAWLVTTGAPVSWSHTSPWLLGSWRAQAGTLALTTSGAGFYCTSHRNLVL